MSKIRFIEGVVNAIGINARQLRNALRGVAIAALLAASCAAYAQETPIQIAIKDGKTTAQFKVGDSRCVLVNDEIRCTPVGK
jgi:hypothetical protein